MLYLPPGAGPRVPGTVAVILSAGEGLLGIDTAAVFISRVRIYINQVTLIKPQMTCILLRMAVGWVMVHNVSRIQGSARREVAAPEMLQQVGSVRLQQTSCEAIKVSFPVMRPTLRRQNASLGETWRDRRGPVRRWNASWGEGA